MSNSKPHILVVDDEPDIRNILQDILQDEGYTVSLAENAEQARKQFRDNQPNLVLLDIWMPKEDGISVLKHWVEHKQLGNTPVVMISGHGTVENAVEAVKLGAYDFLEKPLSTGKLLLSVERGLENASLREENRQLKSRLQYDSPIISNSDASRELMRHVQLLGPTDSWVFITGESGVGKRLVARKVHENSPRADAQFVELNLAAMPSEGVAQALFGSEADGKVVIGRFEEAKGGTLFINEVLGLTLDTQNKLLSALQERQFLRLGGSEYIELDVRVIVTTSGNPQKAVNQGTFSEDLYYRLNVIPIQVPSLRHRRKDLPELIELFIEDTTVKNQLPRPAFNDDAMQALIDYSWPGNVRQLQNVLQRLLILNTEKTIMIADVTDALGGDGGMQQKATVLPDYFDGDMRQAKEAFEKAYLNYHLGTVDGNVSALAKKVGLERTHLYRKLKSLDISARDAK
ncbi:sigma-54-dependent transcriptional regulator [Arenicella xantha]|uniref:DNA-binding NtrC family response regulator n=1 Tax=Arenicella xantha TaxID=644221 RepID=A0A395JJ79_9GAMM|nr:sigma-54 dependent transcriptional regulator [Arenicella xantha]RBP48828.1 DNA-binding NtrC family response regulator [Arenicella xantha]